MCHCTWGPFLTDQQTQLVLSPLEKSTCVFSQVTFAKDWLHDILALRSVWIPRLRRKYWSFLCVLLNNQCKIELAMNLPSLFRSFDIKRSDGRSSLTLHISVAGQWLSPLRVNPYPTRDCLRINNPIKWRMRKFHHINVNSRYRSPFITSSRNLNCPCNSVVNKSMSLPPPLT